jgi:hypothetical protein
MRGLPVSCHRSLTLAPAAVAVVALAVSLEPALAPAPVQASPTDGVSRTSCSQGALLDPFALYGDQMHFRVLRNGSPVGEHRVDFRRQGNELIVDTRFEVAVNLLFITAYRYQYQATDVWRDGCLVDLQVAVNDDGERFSVRAREQDGMLAISGPKGTTTASLGLFPTHHWHAGVLDETRVLNTITGRVADVRIVERGPETVVVNGQKRPARAFVYTGELQTEVWYDERGRWVKMRFAGQDGSTIEYICETCTSNHTASR